jgi:hypothetical protein
MSGSGTPFSIIFPDDIDYELKLTPGMPYQILAQVMAGFPTAYGLIISQDYEIIFAGVTDWRIDGEITIDDGFWPLTRPSFDVKLGRKLEDRYMEIDNDVEFRRETNLEVDFTLGDKTFSMIQGQSAILGNYKIELTLAVDRDTQYKRRVMDGGGNAFSFIFIKLV